jgi:capsular polysaccharide biosynthesis protein
MNSFTFFRLNDLLSIVQKYWLHLIAILVIAFAVSWFFSGPRFLQPWYKSTAIVYPVNLSPYSTETPTEQLLQLLESDDLKDSLITHFRLMEHYRVDPALPFAQSVVFNKLKKNLTISNTRFESVYIQVLDKNPEYACMMINDLIDQLNIKIRNIYRKQFDEVYTIVKNQMDLKKSELDSLDTRLNELTVDYELFDVPAQANEVVRGYLGTVDGSNGEVINHENVAKFMQNIIYFGSEHVRTSGYAYSSRNQYLDLKNQFENVQKEVTKELSYVNIVNSPKIPLVPAYNLRMYIVFFTSAGVLFISFLLFAFFEALKLKKKAEQSPAEIRETLPVSKSTKEPQTTIYT